MAIYEYECENGHTAEVMRKMSERNDPLPCEDCNGMMTRPGMETSNTKVKKPAHRRMRVWSVPFHRTEVAKASWS